MTMKELFEKDKLIVKHLEEIAFQLTQINARLEELVEK